MGGYVDRVRSVILDMTLLRAPYESAGCTTCSTSCVLISTYLIFLLNPSLVFSIENFFNTRDLIILLFFLQMGYDLSLTRAPIEPIRRVMAACRAAGYPVMHTREGHRPDLSDLPANKLWRSEQIGAGIGSDGPTGKILVRGEPGWELIPELAAEAGEVVIDKPGKGSFCATDLDLILRTKGIRNIVLAGITTDVCVSTTMREANDLGYECLLLTDCTGATEVANRDAIFSMVKKQGGVFGAVASSDEFIAAITGTPLPEPTVSVEESSGAVAKVPDAAPYAYDFPITKTALIMIDFQKDFIYEGGFGAALGNDVDLLKACLPGAARILAAARASGIKVVHTLEAHKPDLSGKY